MLIKKGFYDLKVPSSRQPDGQPDTSRVALFCMPTKSQIPCNACLPNAMTDERSKRSTTLKNNIIPKAIQREVQESLKTIYATADETVENVVTTEGADYNINETILHLEKEMLEAAEKLEFERAAALRDKLKKLKDIYD